MKQNNINQALFAKMRQLESQDNEISREMIGADKP